jgi:lipopolysaccharide transport system ATP-binding protein
MNDDLVLQVENVGKCFKIYPNPWLRAFEWISLGKRAYHQPFWALQNISFTVRRGEFWGIIGQNGAGKSTLLKILTGIIQPTTGIYHVQGKLLSLFGLSSDFNMELSGRENVSRSSELLGFPNDYVQTRLERILEFSELGEFFDRPVKTYSAGMRTRLAFSLFTFLECDVLILDEVLATGDIFFKQKCYTRLEELIAKNTTIILVTHAMNVVQQFCQHVILLDKGQKLFDGDSQQGIQLYLQRKHTTKTTHTILMDDLPERSRATSEVLFWPADETFTIITDSEKPCQARLVRFALCNEKGEACVHFKKGDIAYFCCEFQLHMAIGVPISRMMVTNQFNLFVHGKNSFYASKNVPCPGKVGDLLRLCQQITLGLKPGQYGLGIILSTLRPEDYDSLPRLSAEELSLKIVHIYRNDQVASLTILPDQAHPLQQSFCGICDLPGHVQFEIIAGRKNFYKNIKGSQ